MAEFDPYAPQEPQQNYLGYSRGVVPDTSIGGAFSDLGTMISSGTRFLSDLTNLRIGEEVRPVVDDIQDQAMGRADSDFVRLHGGGGRLGQGTPTPREVQEYGARLEALSRARAAGTMRDSHYWTLLDMEARRIRQRYPGHRMEVDQAFSRMVGGIPANELIQSLNREATSRTNNEAQIQEHWRREASQHGLLPDEQQRIQAGNPVTVGEMQQRVNAFNLFRTRQSQEAARLASISANRGNLQAEAYSSAVGGLTHHFANVFNIVSSPFGSNRQRFEDQMAYALEIQAQGGTVQPQQLQTLVQMWNGLGPQVRQSAQAFMYGPSDPGNPRSQSYAQMIGDETKVKQILDAHMANFDNIGTALTQGQFGLLQQAKLMNEQISLGNQNFLLSVNADLQNMQALSAIMGAPLMAELVRSGRFTATMSDIQKAQEMNARVRLAGPVATARGERPPVFTRMLQEIPQEERNLRGASLVDHVGRMLRRQDLTEQQLEMYVSRIFGPGNEALLNEFANKEEVFMQLAGDPQVAQNILRLKNANPDLFNTYHTWVVRNFAGLMREQTDNLSNIVATAGESELRFDPNTWTFGSSTGQPWSGINGQAVERLNNTLRGVRALVQATVPDENEQRRVLATMLEGVNMNQASRGGTVRNLWEAAMNGLNRFTGGRPAYGAGSSDPDGTSRTGQYAGMLDVIGGVEAARHGYTSISGNRNLQNLNNMTIAEVRQLQSGMRQEPTFPSSAIGRYQFVQGTLNRLLDKLSIPDTAVFNNALQDRLALELMRERGLDRYLQNPTPRNRESFLEGMTQEWAAVGRADGTSPHDGTRGNRVNRSARARLEAQLDRMLEAYGRRNN